MQKEEVLIKKEQEATKKKMEAGDDDYDPVEICNLLRENEKFRLEVLEEIERYADALSENVKTGVNSLNQTIHRALGLYINTDSSELAAVLEIWLELVNNAAPLIDTLQNVKDLLLKEKI